MKYFILFLACMIAACEPRTETAEMLPEAAGAEAPTLETGTWTGGLTPMNHPDMTMPMTYDVRRDADGLAISLAGEQGEMTPTHDVALDGDTLRFAFNEPEENVLLTCALGRQADASYAGRCTDAEGKWAHFTMVPPAVN